MDINSLDTSQIDNMLKSMAKEELKKKDETIHIFNRKIDEALEIIHSSKVKKQKSIKAAVCVILCAFVLSLIYPQKTEAAIQSMITYIKKGKDYLLQERYFTAIDKTIIANDVNVNVSKVAADKNTVIIVYEIRSNKFDFSKGYGFSDKNTELHVSIDGQEIEPDSAAVSAGIYDKNTLKLTQSIEYTSLPDSFKVDFNYKKVLDISGDWHFVFYLNNVNR